MENFRKVSIEELKEILKTVKYYRRCEVEYTAPLKSKMLVKDRTTKEANPLLEGFVHKIVNVNSLVTVKEGISAYQMRAENNNKGADYKEFKKTWWKLVKGALAKHKNAEKFYFIYEVDIKEEGGKAENVNTKFKEYLLNGKRYLGNIGDVWKKKEKNERGVDVRLITLEHIDRISIEGLKLEVIK